MSKKMTLTIDELAAQVGVPVRTVRFYIAEGLLSGPDRRGRASSYGEEHLCRLRLIRRLSEQRVPLADVRSRIARLSIEELRSLLAEEDRRAADLECAARSPSPKEYVSALLRRAHDADRNRLAEAPHAIRFSRPEFASFHSDTFSSAATWRRWELAPGIELHVRSDAEDERAALVERLLHMAGLVYHRPDEDS